MLLFMFVFACVIAVHLFFINFLFFPFPLFLRQFFVCSLELSVCLFFSAVNCFQREVCWFSNFSCSSPVRCTSPDFSCFLLMVFIHIYVNVRIYIRYLSRSSTPLFSVSVFPHQLCQCRGVGWCTPHLAFLRTYTPQCLHSCYLAFVKGGPRPRGCSSEPSSPLLLS